MLTDGSHTYEAVIADKKLLRPLASRSTLALFDDLEYSDVARAFKTLTDTNVLTQPIECIKGETRVNYDHAPRRFTLPCRKSTARASSFFDEHSQLLYIM